jgi:hypothetical protein
MTRREKILLGVFVGIAVVAFVFRPQDDLRDIGAGAGAKSTASQRANPARSVGVSESAASKRFPDDVAKGNLFLNQGFIPPVIVQRPPPPEPPAFPFSYLGLWREQEKEIVMLSAGRQIIRLRQGEVLQNTWQLDQISPEQLVFTYLPLKMTKTMRIPQ